MLLNDSKLDEDLRLVGLVLTIKIEFNYLSQVSINISSNELSLHLS